MNPSRVRACSAPPDILKGGALMANSWGSASYFDPNLQLVQEITEPSLKDRTTHQPITCTNPEASGGSHPGDLLLQPSANPEASGGSHPGGLLLQPSANPEASGGSHPGDVLRQLPSDKDALASPKFSRPANVFSSISPRRYLSADQVMGKYARYKNRRDVGRLAIALAKCTYFGAATMAESTITGRGGTAALDPSKLEQLKANIRSIFPTMSDAEFEAIWGLCVASIASACKNLRKQQLAGTL